ncbi:cupredoxin domain-containing protein [Conexibacter sp. JD483]|uniref:cupredoxin domain-containing protein n=1 Tax=unclassified Conexibacter TaxID=2627773 RepID=UPI0027268B69|nr:MULTISPECIES: cupredoxin domain-containing protein [unclassified Conexibacter]MDO8187404.1 cupredoxin domain-containing protein [Conexibacter sp. CPCC 205706]MDO8200999.1 cupredoxin domain-containing protein [Conexibacter sp. CPCC 205762]MDR9370322.1 cupredoxin domain-containing protein [Conexibacter sp. JD483]
MPLHTPSARESRPRAGLSGALARAFASLLAVLLLVVAGGCGAPAPVDVAESQPIAIAMSEFRLTPQTIRLNGAGRRSFEIRNDGTMVHRFELRNADNTRRIALGAPLRPGQSQTLTVRLARGSYLMRCAQERHNTLGEHGELVVG